MVACGGRGGGDECTVEPLSFLQVAVQPCWRMSWCVCVYAQDELDAYDAHQKELEERMDEKTAALIHLQVCAACQLASGGPSGPLRPVR
jgi:hypothetical protein